MGKGYTLPEKKLKFFEKIAETRLNTLVYGGALPVIATLGKGIIELNAIHIRVENAVAGNGGVAKYHLLRYI